MKVWITKYAFTRGILVKEADKCVGASSTVRVERSGSFRGDHYFGNEWHRSEEAAQDRVEEMVGRRVVSLRKQIVDLEALILNGVEVHNV